MGALSNQHIHVLQGDADVALIPEHLPVSAGFAWEELTRKDPSLNPLHNQECARSARG
jgi:hypothetical protein